MPKAILEFNLPEEREEHEDALKGSTYKCQLDDVWNKVFRPRHKHGYSNEVLNKFVQTSTGRAVMDELEKLYREAIEYYE